MRVCRRVCAESENLRFAGRHGLPPHIDGEMFALKGPGNTAWGFIPRKSELPPIRPERAVGALPAPFQGEYHLTACSGDESPVFILLPFQGKPHADQFSWEGNCVTSVIINASVNCLSDLTVF